MYVDAEDIFIEFLISIEFRNKKNKIKSQNLLNSVHPIHLTFILIERTGISK